MESFAGRERRKRDLAGRIARATFPVRRSVGEFIGGLPCNVIGHHWVDIPQWRSRVNAGHRMRFRCSRCSMRGGSN